LQAARANRIGLQHAIGHREERRDAPGIGADVVDQSRIARAARAIGLGDQVFGIALHVERRRPDDPAVPQIEEIGAGDDEMPTAQFGRLQDRVSKVAQRALVVGVGSAGTQVGERFKPVLQPGQDLVDKNTFARPAEITGLGDKLRCAAKGRADERGEFRGFEHEPSSLSGKR